jgi:hypothetical protein
MDSLLFLCFFKIVTFLEVLSQLLHKSFLVLGKRGPLFNHNFHHPTTNMLWWNSSIFFRYASSRIKYICHQRKFYHCFRSDKIVLTFMTYKLHIATLSHLYFLNVHSFSISYWILYHNDGYSCVSLNYYVYKSFITTAAYHISFFSPSFNLVSSTCYFFFCPYMLCVYVLGFLHADSFSISCESLYHNDHI